MSICGNEHRTALALRDELAASSPTDNSCRLIFSEADNLPGIVADRYNDLVILQLLTQGTAQDDVRHTLTEVLREHLQPATIVERPDPKIRELEQLAPAPSSPLYSSNPDSPQLTTIFTINGVHFHYDASAGQKTGAFLDQRLNYAAAARYARGTALDICTYQGGFALHLAQRCERVTGVDASRAALVVADRNLELNPTLQARSTGSKPTPSNSSASTKLPASSSTPSSSIRPPSPSPNAPPKAHCADTRSSTSAP